MNQVYSHAEKFMPQLRRYAMALARDPVVADDLVQDSLLRALSKSHLYRPDTNLRAWLFKILHNQHISNKRREARTGTSVDPDDVAEALATRPTQEAGLVIRSIDRALGHLPREQRRLIEAVSLDSKSYQEVSKSSGLPVGTVKSRISRGRAQLRKLLDGHHADAAVDAHSATGRWRPRNLGGSGRGRARH